LVGQISRTRLHSHATSWNCLTYNRTVMIYGTDFGRGSQYTPERKTRTRIGCYTVRTRKLRRPTPRRLPMPSAS
jgi:hypothetical protein